MGELYQKGICASSNMRVLASAKPKVLSALLKYSFNILLMFFVLIISSSTFFYYTIEANTVICTLYHSFYSGVVVSSQH